MEQTASGEVITYPDIQIGFPDWLPNFSLSGYEESKCQFGWWQSQTVWQTAEMRTGGVLTTLPDCRICQLLGDSKIQFKNIQALTLPEVYNSVVASKSTANLFIGYPSGLATCA